MKTRVLSGLLAMSVLASSQAWLTETVSAAQAGQPAVISAGLYHTAAVKADGSLWVWGLDEHGQVGNGKSGASSADARSVYQASPVKVMDSAASVSAGASNTIAIKAGGGSLWAWGENAYGLAGASAFLKKEPAGTAKNNDVLTPFNTMVTGVSAVSVSDGYAMAIISGSLWAYGRNNAGQLGDGSAKDRAFPVHIMDSVAAVATGSAFTMALKTDGSLWIWGDNSRGQLGSGKTGGYNASPQKIMDSVAVIAAGGYHAMAVKTDGALWAWGYNNTGQLGDGTATSRNTPVKIMGSVAAVSAGVSHSCAIKTDGSLWAWGGNGFGQIGDGAGGSKNANSKKGDYTAAPIKIMDSAAAVSAGGYHTAAVKADGSLWAWGDNEYGQLGDGTQTERHNPVKIMDGLALPAGNTNPAGGNQTASPTAAKVLVNGKEIAFDAYNIGGSNYFKLRDLAYALNGSAKQFEISWNSANNAISLIRGKRYTVAGGEMTGKRAGGKTAVPANSKIFLDGKEVFFTAYNISGSNYFKLRDIGQALDFGVGWNAAAGTVFIDTGIGYQP